MSQIKFFAGLSLLALSPLTFSQNLTTTHSLKIYDNYTKVNKAGIQKTAATHVGKTHPAIKQIPAKKITAKKTLSFKLTTNSLYNNVSAFSKKNHYRLIWDVINPATNDTTDFRVMAGDTIKAASNLGLLKQMTSAYPINVEVWQANHVIRVTTS